MAEAVMIREEEALLEKVRREKARRDVMAFAQYIAPWYQPARHHYLVAEKLHQVERFIATKGKEGIGRLMVFEPPRHGKTEEVSRIFPAWLLGRLPDTRVILTSYGADLAQDDSRAVREYVSSERYRNLFGSRSSVDAPVELSDDSRSRANWNLADPHRGGVVAAGVGGGITGKGANLLVIDDPFKNRDEAESESYRSRVDRWYRSSAYTRLEDGAAVVVMHTRWHREDLAGQLLTRMVSDPLADQWEIVFLPMQALEEQQYPANDEQYRENLLRGIYIPRGGDQLGRQPGEALWPEKYGQDDIARIRTNIDEYEFSALDQQLPEPASGGFFSENMFEIVERAPEKLQWYCYVDLALGKTAAADWNTALPCAMDKEGYLYYRDMLRVHELTEFLVQLKEMMITPWEKGTIWGIESVAFSSLVFQELMKEKKLANVSILEVTPEKDKVARARPMQTRGRTGKIRLVRGAWNQSFLREALTFPTGRHDDQVDTASGGLEMVAQGANGWLIY